MNRFANIKINPVVKFNDDETGIETIKFEFAGCLPFEIKNMDIGEKRFLQAIHNYHDINGSSHGFVYADKKNENIRTDNPYDGKTHSGKKYLITRLSQNCIQAAEI